MIKKRMISKTIEGFINKLNRDGYEKYAAELRMIIAMSRKRQDAITFLSSMTIPLLVHLIKVIFMPSSISVNKWRGEIRGYLNKFNIRNKSPQGHPWLSIEYIQADLNDVVSNPDFLISLKDDLKEYPEKIVTKILRILPTKKTIKSIGVKLSFDFNNRLNISINNQPL